MSRLLALAGGVDLAAERGLLAEEAGEERLEEGAEDDLGTTVFFLSARLQGYGDTVQHLVASEENATFKGTHPSRVCSQSIRGGQAKLE